MQSSLTRTVGPLTGDRRGLCTSNVHGSFGSLSCCLAWLVFYAWFSDEYPAVISCSIGIWRLDGFTLYTFFTYVWLYLIHTTDLCMIHLDTPAGP